MIERTSKAGSSSCECLTTLFGMQKGNEERCEKNSTRVEENARGNLRGHCLSLDLVQKRNGAPHTNSKRNGCN